MYGGRFIQRPLLIIDEIVETLTSNKLHKGNFQKYGIPWNTPPKYMMFSGHDTNVANIWSYLQPIEFKQDNLIGQFVDWYQVPYATSI